jgi:hypothetical protein
MRIRAGLIECRIHTTADGYRDDQVHKWEIGRSGHITNHVLVPVPAAWNVPDNGKLNEQTRTAHWNTDGTKPAPMQVRLAPLVTLESAHAQLTAQGTSVQQLAGLTPHQYPYTVWEIIPFPLLEWNPKLGHPFAGQTNTMQSAGAWEQPGGAQVQAAWSWNIQMEGVEGVKNLPL